MQGKVNRDEYITFFTNWVFYQFDRPSNRVRNILIIIACKALAEKAIEAVTA
jgi:hypothetical protein